MNRDTALEAASSVSIERGGGLGHRSFVLAALTLVILVDQTTKWWAWRHVPGTIINFGANALIGAKISEWYANPVKGAVLDLVGVGVLSFAVSVLWLRRLPTWMLISGALTVGGWSSNLLDRLGAHYFSAPGSVRGAVDFIPLGSLRYNLADVFIASGTLLLLLVVGCEGTRAQTMPPVAKSLPQWMQGRPGPARRTVALAGGVALAVVVGIGAANYGGVTRPLQRSAHRCDAGLSACPASHAWTPPLPRKAAWFDRGTHG